MTDYTPAVHFSQKAMVLCGFLVGKNGWTINLISEVVFFDKCTLIKRFYITVFLSVFTRFRESLLARHWARYCICVERLGRNGFKIPAGGSVPFSWFSVCRLLAVGLCWEDKKHRVFDINFIVSICIMSIKTEPCNCDDDSTNEITL